MNRYNILLGKEPPPVKEPPFESATQDVDRGAPEPESNVRREEILGQYLRTQEGRQRLANSMIEPLHRRLNYSSLARRAFLVDPLPPGALPIYSTAGGASFALGADRESAVEVRNGYVPMVDISSQASIPFSQLRANRFNLIDRAQDLIFNDINAAEGNGLERVLDASVNSALVPPHTTYLTRNLRVPQLNNESIMGGFLMVERNDLRVANIFMNAREYMVLRQTANQLDLNTHRGLLDIGFMGTLLGANVHVSSTFPEGRIYFMAAPEFVGRVPHRNVEVLSADDPMSMQIGWAAFENIGLCCTNPFGVACVTISE